MIRLLVLVVFLCLPAWAAGEGGREPMSLDEGIDRLSQSLATEIATRYFHVEKKPVIKVAVFDFTDQSGDMTVGSRYVTDRVRLEFGNSPQFDLLALPPPSPEGPLVTSRAFEENVPLRERILAETRADVYVFGWIDTSEGSSVACHVEIWGTRPPFDDFTQVVNLRELSEKEQALPADILSPPPWRMTLSPSGLAFFSHILVKGSVEEIRTDSGKLGEVIFLSQPMCDDLNLSWQVKGDGMVYDIRKESETGTLRSRTGQIMQSRVKSLEALKELSYIIKNVGLVIKEADGTTYPFEFYILPRSSDFYFIPFEEGVLGLRFMYLWAKRGLSKNPSPHESGKGWRLYVAQEDYRTVMPLGTHIATATLEPIAESEYGTKKPRSEYVSRFKFDVLPGLNVYVVNYVFRRDWPEIFVRRLEIEGTRDEPVREVKRITEVYRVYGE